MDNLIDLVPYILVGLIGLVVGALIGVFLDNLINRSETTSGNKRRDLVEVMRVWQDRHSGDVQLEFEGKIFPSPEKLDDKNHADLTRWLEEVNRWIGMPKSIKSVSTTPPSLLASSSPAPYMLEGTNNIPKPAPLPSGGLTYTSPNQAEKDKASPSPYEIFEDMAKENKPSSILNPANILERALKPRSYVETPELKSIAVQIDEILQEKLPSTPLKNHVIKLLELPEKGLVVLVDQQQYQGVNDVPDTEIRAFLQECVAEWEQRVGS